MRTAEKINNTASYSKKTAIFNRKDYIFTLLLYTNIISIIFFMYYAIHMVAYWPTQIIDSLFVFFCPCIAGACQPNHQKLLIKYPILYV